uniref:probable methyltransferase-like protein 25 n=1 Tax=Panthera onca TaxID=9690 RepID=UPI0029536544|nr:probable methyltransferase-like protein 25 [Panthera onca]
MAASFPFPVTQDLSTLRAKLQGLLQFLREALSISSAHTVDFYTESVWKQLVDLPPETVLGVLRRSAAEAEARSPEARLLVEAEMGSGIANFPQIFCETSQKLVSVEAFALAVRYYSVQNLGICTPFEQLLTALRGNQKQRTGENVKPDEFMNLKKSHEVQVMSELISSIADYCGIKQVREFVCIFRNLGSLVIWGRLKKGLHGQGGEAPPPAERQREEKEWLRKCGTISGQEKDLGLRLRGIRSLTFLGLGPAPCSRTWGGGEPGLGAVVGQSLTPQLEEVVPIMEGCMLIQNRPASTTPGLRDVVAARKAQTAGGKRCRFPGVLWEKTKAACVRHLGAPSKGSGSVAVGEESTQDKWGFPMCHYLKEERWCCGRNARMSACLALERVAVGQGLPTESLFYRAVLQDIIKECYGITKCFWREPASFEIVNVVFTLMFDKEKLFLNCCYISCCFILKLPEKVIMDYYEKYKPRMNELEAFNMLKVVLAPCIETLILLDRLCYLKEQENIAWSALVKLFDPVKSPRCYAIIALKKQQ